MENLESIIGWINWSLFLIFVVLYAHQIFYAFIPFIKKQSRPNLNKNIKKHTFGVVIAARNEENVIKNLIESIHRQTYDADLIQVFVVADNCQDNTAQVAREMGATVFERFDHRRKGKGYALDMLFKKVKEMGQVPDAYIIFDADNILCPTYIEEMNKTFDLGYQAITSYRNSMNYDTNWISAGYGLWFLRESKYLNHSRMQLGTSCAVSGTGFLVSSEIIEKNNGWIHHLLTEDIEFSVDSVLHGVKIGYCQKAMFYDEQPITFHQSWVQRLRWSKGFYQVFGKYGKDLLVSTFKKHKFAAYDMLMTIAPALFISLGTIVFNGFFMLIGLFSREPELMMACASAILAGLFNYYMVLFIFGVLTTVTEWKQIHASSFNKVKYCFTFPLFMFTYVPIAIAALRKDVEWVPIQHGQRMVSRIQ